MEIYYTDQSNTTGFINNNNFINNYFNKEDIDDDDELHFYEFGAHFQYKDLVTRLNYLLQLSSQEEKNQKLVTNKNPFQVKKSRNITQTTNNMNFLNKDIFLPNKANFKNEIQFQFNNDNSKYENNNNILTNQTNSKSKQQSKTSEHSSTVHKQNKKPNQSNLVISSLTVTDKMSKLNNHIKTKNNSNSNCSYQNINNNNKPLSPPSSINNKYIKTKISSIKFQNTTNPNNTSSNKSNPNLILYPSSSKSKSQLKAISELLKTKIKKGKNSITNSNNISSYSSKSRNIAKPNNKTVHCILNHNNNINITKNNNLNNCFDIQYPHSKPHSIERKVSSNNNSRKINSYSTKPKVNTYNLNGQSGKNTLFSTSLNPHSKNEMKQNNTTQYSQNSMNLSINTCVKRKNGYCGGYNNKIISGNCNSKHIKQKIISAGNNGSNSNSKTKSSPKQKQKVPSRNARNFSAIKNSINQTQNSHGNGNIFKKRNYASKKGSDVNCHSNTINSHMSSKRKDFANSISINQAINIIRKRKSEISSNNASGTKGKQNKK